MSFKKSFIYFYFTITNTEMHFDYCLHVCVSEKPMVGKWERMLHLEAQRGHRSTALFQWKGHVSNLTGKQPNRSNEISKFLAVLQIFAVFLLLVKESPSQLRLLNLCFLFLFFRILFLWWDWYCTEHRMALPSVSGTQAEIWLLSNHAHHIIFTPFLLPAV